MWRWFACSPRSPMPSRRDSTAPSGSMASSVPIRSSPPRTRPFLELVPHGELTPKLWTLRVGDAVSLRPRPKGVFTLEEKFPVHLLVAMVTGIAPFVSMLRHAIHRGERRFRFVVLQGASYQDEFAYRGELEAASARHPELLPYISP